MENSNKVIWDKKLNLYKEKYESYLKKSALGETDENLKVEIENLNNELEQIVKNIDNENDKLLSDIEITKKEIKKFENECSQKKNNQEKKENEDKDINISLSKKIRNIESKEEETNHTIFLLKCVILFFIVCIAILLYFLLK